MIIVKTDDGSLVLPISDRELCRISQNSYELFLPYEDAYYLSAEVGGFDFKEKLPLHVCVQEANMLAYALQQLNQQQIKIFQESIQAISKLHTGEMLNLVLSICPKAAGFSESIAPLPLYTGENLFDLMQYKRFQDWRREYSQFQLVKFYVPVDVTLCSNETHDLEKTEAAVYQPQISEMLDRRLRPSCSWDDWDLYPYSVQIPRYRESGLLFERPDVEIRDGELWGVIIAGVDHFLSDQEIDKLKDYFNGGISDAWGENLPGIKQMEGELFVFFDTCTEVRQQSTKELQLTEQEMFGLLAPYNAKRLLNTTGFVPDFRDEWSYRKEYPVWMEVSYNRKTVRIPLPTENGKISKAYQLIGIQEEARPTILLRVPEITLLDRNYIYKIELSELNQLANEVRKMNPKSEKDIMERYLQNKWPRERLVVCVIETLEQIREEGVEKVARISDSIKML
ncbi:hypothetical protein QMP26_41315 (plasmid) [Enterocloster clostridioformis]